MVLVGLVFFAGLLNSAEQPALHALGAWVRPLHLAVFTHLLLAFPSGRLDSRLAAGVVGAVYLDLGSCTTPPGAGSDRARREAVRRELRVRRRAVPGRRRPAGAALAGREPRLAARRRAAVVDRRAGAGVACRVQRRPVPRPAGGRG